MKLFTFALGPLGWILRIFWNVIKKYWIVILVILYLFRHPLVSSPLCRWIEKKIHISSGLTVKIEKIRGTYFTNISVHNLKLLTPNETLIQAEIQEIQLSYNILAPIFGQRIFQKILIRQPNIIVHLDENADLEEISNLESKPYSLSENLSGIDWPIIFENCPLLEIIQANIEYQQGNRKILAQNFDFHNSPDEGRLKFAKILWHDEERTQSLQNFDIAWQLKNRVLTIEKMKINLPGYPGELVLEKALRLDLQNPNIAQGYMEFPLPGGGHLRGKMDAQEGCFWELSHAEFSLSEILPWVDLIKPGLPQSSAFLHLSIALKIPKWDITQLQGNFAIGLSHTNFPISWKMPEENTGIHTQLKVEDLGLLLPWSTFISPKLALSKLSGKLDIQQQTRTLSPTKVTHFESQGNLYSEQLKFSYLPSAELGIQWHVQSDIESSQLELKKLLVNFLGNQLQFQGNFQWGNGAYISKIQGEGESKGKSLQQFLPDDIKIPFDCSWQSQWKIQAEASLKTSIKNSLPEYKIQAKQEIIFPLLTAYQYLFNDIKLKYSLEADPKKINIPELVLDWQKTKILQGSLNLETLHGIDKIQKGAKLQSKAKISIPKVEQHLAKFFPELANIFNGDILVEIVVTEANYSSLQQWNVEGDIVLNCYNGYIRQNENKIPYRELKFQTHFRIDPKVLYLSSWQFFWDNFIQCKGMAKLPLQKSQVELSNIQVIWDKQIISNFNLVWNYKEMVGKTKGQFQLISLANALVKLQPDKKIPFLGKTNIAWQIQANLNKTSPQFGILGGLAFKLQNEMFSAEASKNITFANIPQSWKQITVQLPFSYQKEKLQLSQIKILCDLGITLEGNVSANLNNQQFSLNILTDFSQFLPKIMNHIPSELFSCQKLISNISAQGKYANSLNQTEINLKSEILVKEGILGKVPFLSIEFVGIYDWKNEIAKIGKTVLRRNSEDLITLSGQIALPEKQATNLQIYSDLAKMIKIWGPTFLGKNYEKDWKLAQEIPLQVNWKDDINQIASGKFHFTKIKYQDWQLRDVSLQCIWKEPQIDCQLQAIVNGGKLTGEGQIIWPQKEYPKTFQFKIKGEKVLAFRNETISSRANLDLVLQGKILEKKKTSCKISGKIEVVDVEIRQEMSLQQSGERVQFHPSVEIPGLEVLLDLIVLFPKITLANNLLQIESQGKLDVQGTLANPQIKGFINTQSGKLFLPQGLMDIRECWIRFKQEDPLIPYIQIKAETFVRDYRIFVTLTGRFGDLSLDFTSTPPLGQEDILMLLMTGATRQELQDSAGEKLKETGSFILMQQFLNSIGLGNYLSAQVTEESATITVTPPNWNGFALQGKVSREGGMRFRIIYRLEYK